MNINLVLSTMVKLAYKVGMYMDNKEQLIEAIDNYDGYSSGCRKVLKLLVELSIDDVAHISVVQLSKIALLSREMIYQALCTFQQDGFIELVKRTKGKTGTINSIVLKPNKLNQLLQFYTKQLEIQKKYIKK